MPALYLKLWFSDIYCRCVSACISAGQMPQFENECYCCQPSDYEQITVLLNCNPGVLNVRRYNIKSCTCIPCSQERALKDQPIIADTQFYSYSEDTITN